MIEWLVEPLSITTSEILWIRNWWAKLVFFICGDSRRACIAISTSMKAQFVSNGTYLVNEILSVKWGRICVLHRSLFLLWTKLSLVQAMVRLNNDVILCCLLPLMIGHVSEASRLEQSNFNNAKRLVCDSTLGLLLFSDLRGEFSYHILAFMMRIVWVRCHLRKLRSKLSIHSILCHRSLISLRINVNKVYDSLLRL